jgi:hypothetical protein
MNEKQSHVSTDEDRKLYPDTFIEKNSMSDGQVFKKIIRDVSNVPLTRERLIGAQREDQELALHCSKSVTVEEEEKVPVCYFMKDGVLMRK